LVAPVRSVMTVVDRVDEDELELSEHGRYSFVPLLWTP